jgi:hypothetical protein
MAAARAGARTAAVTWGYAELLVPLRYQKLREGQILALIRAGTRGQPPLTCWTPEIVPWAVCSAELTDEVPVIAAWIAVQMACDTFG